MPTTVSESISTLGKSLKSLAKLALQSRKASIKVLRADRDRPLVVMGNGPSLRNAIDTQLPQLAEADTMAVNFAAIAPEFAQIKPKYYVVIDPHFFSGADAPNLVKLWSALSEVDWHMVLILPAKMAKKLPAEMLSNHNITIATINPIGIEGWEWLENLAYSRSLGMPRPRNVLIPSIMAAISLGYKQIYLLGADHSWLESIHVDDENHVVSIQPHFYKDDDKELQRVHTEYMKYPLHQILESFTIAFRSYHHLQRYAAGHGIDIYNATPKSYIDAFPRKAWSLE